MADQEFFEEQNFFEVTVEIVNTTPATDSTNRFFMERFFRDIFHYADITPECVHIEVLEEKLNSKKVKYRLEFYSLFLFRKVVRVALRCSK